MGENEIVSAFFLSGRALHVCCFVWMCVVSSVLLSQVEKSMQEKRRRVCAHDVHAYVYVNVRVCA